MVIQMDGNEADFRTDMIQVKFQDGSKHPHTFIMKIDETFEVHFDSYLQKTNKASESIKFYFDGDLLDKTSSPKDIDMDENFCIDVVFTEE